MLSTTILSSLQTLCLVLKIHQSGSQDGVELFPTVSKAAPGPYGTKCKSDQVLQSQEGAPSAGNVLPPSPATLKTSSKPFWMLLAGGCLSTERWVYQVTAFGGRFPAPHRMMQPSQGLTPLFSFVKQEIPMSHCHSMVIRPNYCLQRTLKLKSAKHYYNILRTLMIKNMQPLGNNNDLLLL